MKCPLSIVLLSAVVLVCVNNINARTLPSPVAARNGMFFYQAAPGYYNPVVPQRAMYVQYGQPYRANRRSATVGGEEGGVSAFAAGNTIAAGTYLKGKYLY